MHRGCVDSEGSTCPDKRNDFVHRGFDFAKPAKASKAAQLISARQRKHAKTHVDNLGMMKSDDIAAM